MLSLAAAGILGVFRFVGRGIAALFRLIGSLFRGHRIAGFVTTLVVAVCLVCAVDFALNGDKVYAGVTIGSVDVSGMTRQEAADAVRAAYDGRVEGNRLVVFSDEETANAADLEQQIVQDEALAEQISFEEAQRNKKLWTVDAASAGASLPADDLAEEAFSVGRTGIAPVDRLMAAVSGRNIPVHVNVGDEQVEALAEDIDAAIGEERVDYGMAIEDGTASVTEGHDGWMVNRGKLSDAIASALLADGSTSTLVAETEYAPLRIDQAQAQATCDAVNSAIAQGARFTYNGTEQKVDRDTLSTWVSSRVDSAGEGYLLAPYIDEQAATPSLVALVNEDAAGEGVVVSFNVDGDDITVTLQDEVTVPKLSSALEALDASLFGSYRAGGEAGSAGEAIAIDTEQKSGTLSFDEAYGCGIVTEIASFTTEFVNSSSTQNRAHNIMLAGDLLDKSVAKANGGTWSFNEIAGDCNEEAGFLPAGSIREGEYVDSSGGGICQVATTVFNAVYKAGYPVTSRRNHSLYIASYPAGRDAAVAYPYLDFAWQNDTSSDVLLRTSHTETSITAKLYGVDPHYEVSTETGDWQPGEKHETKVEVDDTLSPGTSYTKTAGSDGLKISVKRIVKDSEGNVVREDVFDSEYAPVTEVIVKGPDASADGADDEQGKDDAATA